MSVRRTAALFESLEHAAAHWRRLAADEDERARYESARGNDVAAGLRRAALYRATSKSLLLEHQTGEEHCVNCLYRRPDVDPKHRATACPYKPRT